MAAYDFPSSPTLGDEVIQADETVWVCEDATGPIWGPKLTDGQLAALNEVLSTGSVTGVKIYMPSVHDTIDSSWTKENNLDFPDMVAIVLVSNLLTIYDATTEDFTLIKSITVVNGIQVEAINGKIFVASSTLGVKQYDITNNYNVFSYSTAYQLLSDTVRNISLFQGIDYLHMVVADAVGVNQCIVGSSLSGQMTGYTSGCEEVEFITKDLFAATNNTKRLITLEYDYSTDDTLLTDATIVKYDETSTPPVLNDAGWVSEITRIADDHIVFAITNPAALCHLWFDEDDQAKGMVAHVTHEYFSGVMHGDPIAALLANSKTLDRSIASNGLTEVGTVTESAIVSGSDIMAYSGFSAANYFEQAYNTDFNLGSSTDFSLRFLVYRTLDSTNQVIFSRADTDGRPKMSLFVNVNNTFQFDMTDNGGSYHYVGSAPSAINTWEVIEVKRIDDNFYMSLNGQQFSYIINTTVDLSSADASAKIRIGRDTDDAVSEYPWSGSIALFNASKGELSEVDSGQAALFERAIILNENKKVLLQDTVSDIDFIDYDEVGNILSIITTNAITKYSNLIVDSSYTEEAVCIDVLNDSELIGSI